MSDLLTAAAAALGAPEDLVERSAHARAEADGTTYEAVLSGWAGGTPAPPPTAVTAQPETATSAPEASSEPPPRPAAAPAPPTAIPAFSAPVETQPAVVVAAPAPSKATPVLVGARFRPLQTWIILAGLFLLSLVITLIGPFNTGGDFRHLVSDESLSSLGETGRSVYLNQGCGYCHTQLVRPVLADVGLGPVTETFADSLRSATFGVQRIGPDLAHVGSRPSYQDEEAEASVADFRTLLTHPEQVFPDGIHPSYAHLSPEDMEALVTYLVELR